jgi:hypothetical protein
MLSSSLSAPHAGEVLRAATAGQFSNNGGTPSAEASSSSHFAGGSHTGSCCAPSSEDYFIKEDFRGDLIGELCLTIELSLGEDNCTRACIWREDSLKAELVKDGKENEMQTQIVFSSDISQDKLDSILSACGTASFKGLEDISFDDRKTEGATIDCLEILGLDSMGIPISGRYRIRETNEENDPVQIQIGKNGATLTVEDLMSLLIARWIKVNNQIGDDRKKKQKIKKPNVTLVVPNNFGGYARGKLLTAVNSGGGSLKSIYSRGLSAVAGSLCSSQDSQSPLLSAILAFMKNRICEPDVKASPSLVVPTNKKQIQQINTGKSKSSHRTSPVILFVDVSGKFVELSLISCEGKYKNLIIPNGEIFRVD